MNSRRCKWVAISVLLLLLLVACSGLETPADVDLRVATSTQVVGTGMAEQPPEEPAMAPSATLPPAEPTAQPTAALSPTATLETVTEPCSSTDTVWIGTFGYGLNCLDGDGWHLYTEDNSPIGNQIVDIVHCDDDRTWVAHTQGLSVTDGEVWDSFDYDWGYGSVEALACDGSGGIWLAHYEGASHYDGQQWTTYPASDLGSGPNVSLVKDVGVSPDGSVWVVTANSVARLKDGAWKVYEKGQGFDKEYYFERIAIDGKGAVWAAHSSGLLQFAGKKWVPHEGRHLSQVQSLTVDSGDHLWAGTYARGLSKKTDKGWVTHNRENSGLKSDHVIALDVDGQGRVWIGTEWGLSVFAGKKWTTYHMHTAGLADNEIYALAVSGNGPPLPDHVEKAKGSLTGMLHRGAEPLAGAKVEACAELIGMAFSGATPCAGMAFSRAATTGDDGRFRFDDLPEGRYGIAFQAEGGKWMRLTGAFGVGDKKVTVSEGEESALGEIDISD